MIRPLKCGMVFFYKKFVELQKGAFLKLSLGWNISGFRHLIYENLHLKQKQAKIKQ